MIVLSIKYEIYSPESFTTQQNLSSTDTQQSTYHTNLTSPLRVTTYTQQSPDYSLASTDTDTYMDRQTDTRGQHNTYLLSYILTYLLHLTDIHS